MSKRHTIFALLLSFLAGSLLSGAVGAQSDQTQPPIAPALESGYSTEMPISRGYNVDVLSKAIRDDNIFNDNANRQSDFVFQESAVLNFWDERPTWNIGLQYQPTLLLYQNATSLNGADQEFKLNGAYHLTQRFRLQWNEVFDDRAGILEPSSNQYFTLPIGPPPTLNTTIGTPLSRALSNETDLHAIYDTSVRGTVDVTGSYGLMNFSGVGSSSPDLLNTTAAAGGLDYQYRTTARLTLGGRYLFQSLVYGASSSAQVHSVYATILWNLRPHVMLSVYGGPQYAASSGVLPVFAGSANTGADVWIPSGGGSLTFRSDRTVLQLAGQRVVTSGGGLLGTVIDAYEGAELRRKVTSNCDLIFTGGNGRATGVEGGPSSGRIDTQSVGVAVERPLFANLNLHAEYDFLRERVNQFVPLGADANRDQYSVSVFYRFGERRF